MSIPDSIEHNKRNISRSACSSILVFRTLHICVPSHTFQYLFFILSLTYSFPSLHSTLRPPSLPFSSSVNLHSSSPAYLAPLVAQRAVLGNAVKVGLGDVNPRLEVLQKERKANQGRREERREGGREGGRA